MLELRNLKSQKQGKVKKIKPYKMEKQLMKRKHQKIIKKENQ